MRADTDRARAAEEFPSQHNTLGLESYKGKTAFIHSDLIVFLSENHSAVVKKREYATASDCGLSSITIFMIQELTNAENVRGQFGPRPGLSPLPTHVE